MYSVPLSSKDSFFLRYVENVMAKCGLLNFHILSLLIASVVHDRPFEIMQTTNVVKVPIFHCDAKSVK